MTLKDTMISIDRKEYIFSSYCTLEKTASFLKVFASADTREKRELNEKLILTRKEKK